MLSQTGLAVHGSRRYAAHSLNFQGNGEFPAKSTTRHGAVEYNAGSAQNAPSHDRYILGEVAERLNALVLKTSKG
jgi:hypothetical protein